MTHHIMLACGVACSCARSPPFCSPASTRPGAHITTQKWQLQRHSHSRSWISAPFHVLPGANESTRLRLFVIQSRRACDMHPHQHSSEMQGGACKKPAWKLFCWLTGWQVANRATKKVRIPPNSQRWLNAMPASHAAKGERATGKRLSSRRSPNCGNAAQRPGRMCDAATQLQATSRCCAVQERVFRCRFASASLLLQKIRAVPSDYSRAAT